MSREGEILDRVEDREEVRERKIGQKPLEKYVAREEVFARLHARLGVARSGESFGSFGGSSSEIGRDAVVVGRHTVRTQ
jgi:hypothetical protein